MSCVGTSLLTRLGGVKGRHVCFSRNQHYLLLYFFLLRIAHKTLHMEPVACGECWWVKLGRSGDHGQIPRGSGPVQNCPSVYPLVISCCSEWYRKVVGLFIFLESRNGLAVFILVSLRNATCNAAFFRFDGDVFSRVEIPARFAVSSSHLIFSAASLRRLC